MKKSFNVTGVCIPGKHYMVDISGKIAEIFKMVERGDYFVISRPRQYGKTTTLFMLENYLQTREDYFPINISFEGIDKDRFSSAGVFIKEFFLILSELFENSGNDDLVKFIESTPTPDSFNGLGIWIGKLVKRVGKKVVFMIDEVDKSSNNQLFMDFLGMLRNRYLNREKPGQSTFHNVILAGLHDVKSLKLKIRPETEAKLNSPWNIAADFDISLSFTPEEIGTMLREYSQEEQITVDIPLFSEKLHYYTSGYPFLVSYLCKTIHEKILPLKEHSNQWEIDGLEKAIQITLDKNNTNFESLIKNLENDSELYDYVYNIIINGIEFKFNLHNPIIHLGLLHGILKKEVGRAKIHNRIYEQIIYNYMASKIEISRAPAFDNFTAKYLDNCGGLDVKKVLLKFQEFMKENYSKKDQQFLERNGRLLFLAFIRPILNGRGFDFKEVQISEERRLDIVITFDHQKYIIELKVWRGESYHQEGINQLCAYLDKQNQTSGYLLIYDLRKESGLTGKNETIEAEGKTIFAAWV